MHADLAQYQEVLTFAEAAWREVGCNCWQLRSVCCQQGLERQWHRGLKRR